jgi:predicted small lipoprotein YifL
MNAKAVIMLITLLAVTGCGRFGGFLGAARNETPVDASEQYDIERYGSTQTTIWEALRKQTDKGDRVAVNRYLWNASLEVLDFLPVQTVDPFSGVIVTGYGTPPGGGRAYRATIYISDPALDARSLNVAIQTRGGPVAAGTQRAVEDAILTRARQLRVADKRL